MDNLEGGVIFVGKPSFGVSAGKKTKMVANRVYYLWGVPFHMSVSSSRPIGHLRRVCNPSGIIPSRPR